MSITLLIVCATAVILSALAFLAYRAHIRWGEKVLEKHGPTGLTKATAYTKAYPNPLEFVIDLVRVVLARGTDTTLSGSGASSEGGTTDPGAESSDDQAQLDQSGGHEALDPDLSA